MPARSRRRTTTTSIASSPRRSRRAPVSRRGRRCRRCPTCRSRRRARVLDRRRGDDRDRRRVLGARAVRRARRGRHPHRGAGARDRARQRRSTRSARARLSTVYMPGRKITMLPDDVVAAFSLPRAPTRARAVALRRARRGRRAASPRDTVVERVPIAANLRARTRSATRSRTTLPSPTIRRGPRELRALWKLAQRSLRRAASRTSRASTTASTSIGSGTAPASRARDDRAAPARHAARQARRRADDPRQRHVGRAARRRRRRRASIACSRAARSR